MMPSNMGCAKVDAFLGPLYYFPSVLFHCSL